jgi:hypothetical protein
MQWVPPPRELPRSEHLVGPVVNMPIAALDRPAAMAFYQGLLGIGVRFDGEVQSPAVNRIMAAPPDWRFRITVFFLADGQPAMAVARRRVVLAQARCSDAVAANATVP